MRPYRTLIAIAALTVPLALNTWTIAESNTRLVDVVRSGDATTAMEMLKKGAKGQSVEADGTTALHWAARQDDLRLAKALVSAGAQVNAANRYGVTALALAATNGSAPMVALLLNAGADPNAATLEGETVLMDAARAGRPEALKLLLTHGANPNAAEGRFGETALMWAAGHDEGEAVRVLVAGGAKPDTISTVVTLPKVKVDFSFAVGTALPRGGMTALMYAARQGQMRAALALADAGANMNIVDPEGSTAIVIAIVNAHYELAGKLAEKGADPNIGDDAGMAALYAAVDMEHPASLTNRPPQVRTGNITAAQLVKVLLKNRADPNLPLKAPILMKQHNAGDAALGAGSTPLMRAAKAMDVGIMQSLLEGGADPMRKLANGTSPMSLVLAGRGARVLTPDVPMFQAIRLMVEHGYDVNTPITNGATLLHQSVDRGEAFVRLLVEHGAKLDLKDGTGRTPLDIALGVAPATPAAPAAAPAAPAGRGGARGGPGPAAPSAVAAVDAATIALLRGQR